MSHQPKAAPANEGGRKRPSRLLLALARPGLHIVLGVFCLLAFTWPFLTFVKPSHTWLFLHGAWGMSVLVLFLMGRADRRAAAREPEEDGEHG